MEFYDFFDYHQNTKHTYYSVRYNPNRVDWDNQPNSFKYYPEEYKRIKLDKDIANHEFIYFIAGINAKKTYPGVEYYLRINPSAGALYPNEIYFQARNVKGLEDGIYHFEIGSLSVTLLKKLSSEQGVEKNLGFDFSVDGFVFFISSVYYRSSWKYKNRALRYCLLDAGHLLGCMEASTYLYDKSMEIIYDFDKNKINNLFCFDNKEFFTSLVIVGEKSNKVLSPLTLELPCVDATAYTKEVQLFEKNEIIESAYKKSLNIEKNNIQSARVNQKYNKITFKDIILKRRSIREFSKGSITKEQLDSILDNLYEPIKTDCDEELNIYYVVNRVAGLKVGLYKDRVCLKVGDFKQKAGYLCLEQDLGSSSSVTFFITSKAKNYQALYQKAGIIGHRLYLASNYLGIECSGIGAYYDDEVCEFVDDYCMVLYALAIGN